jgi:hypothetical protein
MKVEDDPNLGRRDEAQRPSKRRYEPPRLLTETLDVRGTNKSFHSVIDLHPGISTGSGPSIS